MTVCVEDDAMTKDVFATTLNRLIEERRISPKEICARTGVKASTLSEWRSGTRAPTLGKEIIKLARLFGVSVDYLLTGELPEEKIVGDLLKDTAGQFVTIHKGVYRVKVEKYLGPTSKKSGEKESP